MSRSVLLGIALFKEHRTLFAHLGKHEIFQVGDDRLPITEGELATLASGA